MPALVVLVTLAVAVVGVLTGTIVLGRRRSSPLALPLAVVFFGAAEWAAARSVLALVTAADLRVALNYAIFPGVAAVVGASFWYFLVLAGHGAALSRRTALLLAIHPAVLVVALVTDPTHHLFLRFDGADGSTVIGAGPLYWLHTAYSYGLLLVGMAVVLRAMLRAVPGHRSIYGVTLVAALLPLLGSMITMSLAVGSRSLHLTPVFFLGSAAVWWWVERDGGPSGVVPVSFRQVLGALADAIIVIDPYGRVLDANPAALAHLDGSRRAGRRVVGAHWREVLDAELHPLFEVGASSTLHSSLGAVLDVRFTKISSDTGQRLGSVVALRDVTELERLRTELADQALRDSLTGLSNRRHLEIALAGAVAEATSSVLPLSALMIDVDHFKAVNDVHGHATGDRVLVEVADVLSLGLREGESVARIGGEEFLLLLPGVGTPAAEVRAEELRRRCGRVEVPAREGLVGITVSVGVASLAPGDGGEALLRLADDALYAAKAAGRNRVHSALRTTVG